MTFRSAMKMAPAALVVMLMSTVTINQLSPSSDPIQFSPPTPPDPGTPGDRGQSGGHRGPCDEKYSSITALVPAPRSNSPEDKWGLTVSDRPTIWFDVPTGMQAGTLVEWRLRNEQGKTIYKQAERLPETAPGVVSFPISVAMPIATYQWDLAIYCSSAGKPSGDSSFDQPVIRKGRIQRLEIPRSLQQELSTAKTPVEQAKLYAKHGIWYDTITVLGTALRTDPNQDRKASTAWRDLLRAQNLESPAIATLTDCCTR